MEENLEQALIEFVEDEVPQKISNAKVTRIHDHMFVVDFEAEDFEYWMEVHFDQGSFYRVDTNFLN